MIVLLYFALIRLYLDTVLSFRSLISRWTQSCSNVDTLDTIIQNQKQRNGTRTKLRQFLVHIECHNTAVMYKAVKYMTSQKEIGPLHP